MRRLDRNGIRVARAILFSSFAQGRMREGSDIDVALISWDYRPTDFRQRVRIELICQDVDVRMETVVYLKMMNAVDIYLLQYRQIVRNGGGHGIG